MTWKLGVAGDGGGEIDVRRLYEHDFASSDQSSQRRQDGSSRGSKAESAVKAAAAAAEKAAAEAEAAELASAQPCAASQLVVELGRGGVAMGHVGQLVSFKNISAKTCVLKGYPGVKMFDATGHPIPTEVTDGPDYTVPSLPEAWSSSWRVLRQHSNLVIATQRDTEQQGAQPRCG